MKPLNAFMLYMKDMKPKIVAENPLIESRAISKIVDEGVSTTVTTYSCLSNKRGTTFI